MCFICNSFPRIFKYGHMRKNRVSAILYQRPRVMSSGTQLRLLSSTHIFLDLILRSLRKICQNIGFSLTRTFSYRDRIYDLFCIWESTGQRKTHILSYFTQLSPIIDPVFLTKLLWFHVVLQIGNSQKWIWLNLEMKKLTILSGVNCVLLNLI